MKKKMSWETMVVARRGRKEVEMDFMVDGRSTGWSWEKWKTL